MNSRTRTAFGLDSTTDRGRGVLRTVRSGGRTTLFTIGYERRDGAELISLLRDAGVKVLADIRERPISRKSDFRGAALHARCEQAGISYLGMPELGSPQADRQELRETGDIQAFLRRFRQYARKRLTEPVVELGRLAQEQPVALLCYERCHEYCHRAVIADLVADRIGAAVVAIT
jgi:uncharacterized protein (DUF488 family)